MHQSLKIEGKDWDSLFKTMKIFRECEQANILRSLIRETFAEYEKNVQSNPNVTSSTFLVQSLEQLCYENEEEETTTVDDESDDDNVDDEQLLKVKLTPEKMNVEPSPGRSKRVIRAPVKFSPDQPDNVKDDKKSPNGQPSEPRKRRRRQNFKQHQKQQQQTEKKRGRKSMTPSPQKSSIHNNNKNNVTPKKSDKISYKFPNHANNDDDAASGDSECYDVDHNYSSKPSSSSSAKVNCDSGKSSVPDKTKSFSYTVIDYNHPPVLNGGDGGNSSNNNNNSLTMMMTGQDRVKGPVSTVDYRGGSTYFDTLRLPGSHPSVPVVTQFPHSVEEIVVIDAPVEKKLLEEDAAKVSKVKKTKKMESNGQQKVGDRDGTVGRTKKKKKLVSASQENEGVRRKLGSTGPESTGTKRKLGSTGQESTGTKRKLGSTGQESTGTKRKSGSTGQESTGTKRKSGSTGQEEDEGIKRRKRIVQKPRKFREQTATAVHESDDDDDEEGQPQSRKRKKSKLTIMDGDGRLLCVLCGDDRTYKNRNTLYNHRSIYHNSKRIRVRKPIKKIKKIPKVKKVKRTKKVQK